jgi:hypothetical protein
MRRRRRLAHGTITGTLGRPRLFQAFDALAPLVPHRVLRNDGEHRSQQSSDLANYRPGRGEAVARIPAVDDRFIPDRSFEPFAMTFNWGGYLRRVR